MGLIDDMGRRGWEFAELAREGDGSGAREAMAHHHDPVRHLLVALAVREDVRDDRTRAVSQRFAQTLQLAVVAHQTEILIGGRGGDCAEIVLVVGGGAHAHRVDLDVVRLRALRLLDGVLVALVRVDGAVDRAVYGLVAVGDQDDLVGDVAATALQDAVRLLDGPRYVRHARDTRRLQRLADVTCIVGQVLQDTHIRRELEDRDNRVIGMEIVVLKNALHEVDRSVVVLIRYT